MKLWLLRPLQPLPKDIKNPWKPWYDRAFGFVVRAEYEDEAREIAGKEAGAENPGAWLNSNLSTCIELTPDGPAEIVMQDFASA